MISEYIPCSLFHCRECTSCELICIYYNIYPVLRKLSLCYLIEGCRNNYDRSLAVLLTEFVAEFKYLSRILLAAVYHYSVCTCLNIGKRTFKSVFHALFKYEALDTGDYHEAVCELSFLAGFYFLAEMLDRILCLLYLGPEEGILLKTGLVLDYYSRYTHSLQSADSINEMLDKSACISVEDYGLCSYLHNIVDSAVA